MKKYSIFFMITLFASCASIPSGEAVHAVTADVVEPDTHTPVLSISNDEPKQHEGITEDMLRGQLVKPYENAIPAQVDPSNSRGGLFQRQKTHQTQAESIQSEPALPLQDGQGDATVRGLLEKIEPPLIAPVALPETVDGKPEPLEKTVDEVAEDSPPEVPISPLPELSERDEPQSPQEPPSEVQALNKAREDSSDASAPELTHDAIVHTIEAYEHTQALPTDEASAEQVTTEQAKLPVKTDPDPDLTTEPPYPITRTLTVPKSSEFIVSYPGQGWVYLGEKTASFGIRYGQRKTENNTTIFSFSAEKDGSFILHFSYFDAFSNAFIADAVQVRVTDEAKSDLPIVAPAYVSQRGKTNAVIQRDDSPQTPENQVLLKEAKKDASRILVKAETPSTDTHGDLLKKAREYLAQGSAEKALEAIQQFLTQQSEHLDEAYFLQGRAYEMEGPERNIKKALQSYKKVTEGFPQSSFWTDADMRIRFINRFFIKIR